MFDAQQEDLMQSVADAEAKNRPRTSLWRRPAASVASPSAMSGSAEPGSEGLFCLVFTKAKPLVQTVHALEKQTYHIDRDDRAMRLITTVADNAIQGPNSVHSQEEDRRVDNLEDDMLAEAICNFHIADSAGGGVDKQFVENYIVRPIVSYCT